MSFTTPRHTEIELRIRRLCVQHRLDEALLLRNTVIETARDEALLSMLFAMDRRIASGDTVIITDTIEVPADWWQHFKERWFPVWALKRWLVVKRAIVVATQTTRMCPHVDLSTQHSSHFRWLMAEPCSTPSIFTEK